MTLKRRITIFVTVLFSILYAIVASTIVYLFSDFRDQEFMKRLHQKAMSTYELIQQSNSPEFTFISKMNQYQEDELFNETIYVLNSDRKNVYGNNVLPLAYFELLDFKLLDNYKTQIIHFQNHEVEVNKFQTNYGQLYVIVDAVDVYGFTKLKFLISTLAFSFVFFAVVAYVMTGYTIAKLFEPLKLFLDKIKSINENNLDEKIPVKNRNDEIDLLAKEFNLMLARIDESFQLQREAASNASHELRTPISRIILQLENKIHQETISEDEKNFYNKLLFEATQLSELINALLLLSKNQFAISENEALQRLDEIMYDSIEKICNVYPDFKVYFDFLIENEGDDITEIRGVKSILEIAFMNLLKNAYLYSDNKQVEILLFQNRNSITIKFLNTGNVITEDEIKDMYKPFMRGANSKDKAGFGLGLRIVNRILQFHHATLHYTALDDKLNEFKITFKVNS